MARNNKKTRIKGLPPKVLLQIKDSKMGAYPTQNVLTTNSQSFYNDLNTINYRSASLNLGTQVPLTRISSSNYSEYGQDISSSLYANAVINKTTAQSFLSEVVVDDYQPYVENMNYDSRSLLRNSFHATGSLVEDIGEGFTQPLWAKTKITIDLTPAAEHSFFVENYTSQSRNYPMAYWNNDLKVWEGIGTGRESAFYSIPTITSGNFNQFIEEQCIGFNPSILIDTGIPSYEPGQPINNFGFPEHIKYHGTGSNAILMKDYISSPFLLEKIVLQISCSLSRSSNFANSSHNSLTTFFVLNQKENANKVSYYNFKKITEYGSIVAHVENYFHKIQIPSSSNQIFNGQNISTTRDLITYGHIASITSSLEDADDGFSDKEFIFFNNDTITWSGDIILSATVKVGNRNSLDAFTAWEQGGQATNSNPKVYIGTNKLFSGRNLQNNINPRDFINTINSPEYSNPFTISFLSSVLTSSIVISKLAEKNKNIPYILFPSDKLIFGFQLPLHSKEADNYTGKNMELIFAKKDAKITLYGSYISNGTEYHDTLKQNNNSNSILEVIG